LKRALQFTKEHKAIIYIVACGLGFAGLIASNTPGFEQLKLPLLFRSYDRWNARRRPNEPSSVEMIRQELPNEGPLLSKPEGYLENPELVEEFRNEQSKNGKWMILTGPGGVGKTTFAKELYWKKKDAPKNDRERSQISVYVSLMEARPDFTKRAMEDLICRSMSPAGFPRRGLRKLLSGEHLLLFMDELDKLTAAQRRVVQNFACGHEKTSFVFVVAEADAWRKELPDGHPFPVSPWKRERAIQYLEGRLKDPEKVKKLLADLGPWLKDEEPPLVWHSVARIATHEHADDWFAARVADAAKVVADPILHAYVAIIIEKDQDAFQKLGTVALQLLTENRTTFSAAGSGFAPAQLDKWVGRLLIKKGDLYEFLHINYQLVLASEYIGRHWHEARQKLGRRADTFYWKTVVRTAMDWAQNQGDKDSLAKELHAIAVEMDP